MYISDQLISQHSEPFIIAELSGNHNQSLERALKIVEAVKEAGAHAVKLQTYTADTMTLPLKTSDFMVNDPNSLWRGQSLYTLYQKAHTPWEWHKPIFDRCRELGLIVFSTPFDSTAVDFLESLDVPAYKIASFEIVDLPLIARVASTKKPMIISTGMATLSEIEDAVTTAREAGATEITLLKCTSSYPASPAESHLRTIPHIREIFGVEVGLSDHTLGIGAALAAVALGACIIEKHVTLDRSDGGVDSAFSLEPQELRSLVVESKNAWLALGKVRFGATETEKGSLKFRRSVYTAKAIKKGELLTPDNIRIVRPGYGLAPKYYKLVLGKKATQDIPVGTPLNWELLG